MTVVTGASISAEVWGCASGYKSAPKCGFSNGPVITDRPHLNGLLAGAGLLDLKGDGIVPLQTEMTELLDARLVHKDIPVFLGGNEPEAFFSLNHLT